MSSARCSKDDCNPQNLVFVSAPRAGDISEILVGYGNINHNDCSSLMPLMIKNEKQEQKETRRQQKWQLVVSERFLESSFGAEDDDGEDKWTDSYHDKKQQHLWQELYPTTTCVDEDAVARSEDAFAFRSGRENGYKYELADCGKSTNQNDAQHDTCDEDEDEDELGAADIAGGKTTSRTNLRTSIPSQAAKAKASRLIRGGHSSAIPQLIYYYVLGKIYHPIYNADDRRDDEESLFWFTYRYDFCEIVPYRITTDAGWGCMLRSAQMLLGQTLRLHYKGRDWKPPTALDRRRQDHFVQDILTWFADFPSTTTCHFSLHNMVATGFAKYEILPGEWYGPSSACYVLRDLVQLFEHQQQQQSSTKNSHRPNIFRVHVAGQGTVFRDEIHHLMTRSQQGKPQAQREHDMKTHANSKTWGEPSKSSSFFHPLDPSYNHVRVANQATNLENYNAEWDTSLLLLIPLRLGLKTFHSDYTQSLAFSFSLPQSVGVLGGRPRGARWFYGATSDGSRILGLDPHTIQSSPQLVPGKQRQTQQPQVDLSDDYLESVHTSFSEAFSLSKMDPSIALGFYCKNNAALEHLIQIFGQWKLDHPNLPDLFTVAETTPDYMVAAASEWSEKIDLTLSFTTTSTVGDRNMKTSISRINDLALGNDDAEEDDDEVSHASDEYVML